MKIAVVTDNGSTISRHFGRAAFYLVFTVEDGVLVGQEQRAKPGHQHGRHDAHAIPLYEQAPEPGAPATDSHSDMLEPIRDCAVVITRGMGTGAYVSVQRAGLTPFITDLATPEAAVAAYIDGTLVDHKELLH